MDIGTMLPWIFIVVGLVGRLIQKQLIKRRMNKFLSADPSWLESHTRRDTSYIDMYEPWVVKRYRAHTKWAGHHTEIGTPRDIPVYLRWLNPISLVLLIAGIFALL